MTGQAFDFRIEALLSVQRALWDMVTPALRGVSIRLSERRVDGRFLYEHEPSAEEREIVAEVESYMLADFGDPIEIRFGAQHSPMEVARDLLPGEEWVYLRRETQDE